jgi:leucine dehydrogenase
MSHNTLQPAEGDIFQILSDMGHEQLVFCSDEKTGLKAIIAVHNTVLGPALGGTRFWSYATEKEAITDVLRLSRGMTFKSAISGLNLGGGKAVIIGSSDKLKNREPLFRRYGKFVNSLKGKYITAEDVGTSPADIEFIGMETQYVAGKPEQLGGGGDPSPVTAYGTYLGMKASLKYTSGSDSLKGKKVMVQGAGHVGYYLVERLVNEGALVMVSDINQDRLNHLTSNFKVDVIAPDQVYDVDMDIYAPCALGATVNDDTIGKLRCSIIAGAANNQLKDEKKHGRMLVDRGITYAPDFLINAGGVINCYVELEGYNRDRAYQKAEIIYQRTIDILELARIENITPQEAAIRIASERIAAVAAMNAVL